MEELAIGEVARRAGIRPSALRYYESIGLMPAPKRLSVSLRRILRLPRVGNHSRSKKSLSWMRSWHALNK